MKKQKENSHEGITWSEMGKQNAQAEKVYSNLILTCKRTPNMRNFLFNLQIIFSYCSFLVFIELIFIDSWLDNDVYLTSKSRRF